MAFSAPDFNIFKDTEGVGNKDGCRVVGAHQIGNNGLFVDAHESDRQARLVFVGDTSLVQANHALIFLTSPQHQDRTGQVLGNWDLVTGKNGYIAPSDYLGSINVNAWWIDAPAVALPAEGGNSSGMS